MSTPLKKFLAGLALGAAGALAVFGGLHTCDGRDPAWEHSPPVVLGEDLHQVLRDAGAEVVEEVAP